MHTMLIYGQKSRCSVTLSVLYLLVTLLMAFPAPSFADSERIDRLFMQLQAKDLEDWEPLEREIRQEWAKSGSDSMDYLLERGHAAMEKGDLGPALGHFNALVDHAPDFAEGWNARATVYFNMGQYGLSVSDIQQTLVLNPRHFGAMSGLGMIFEQVEQPKNALKIYKEVLKIHPHRPDVLEAVERLEQAVGGAAL